MRKRVAGYRSVSFGTRVEDLAVLQAWAKTEKVNRYVRSKKHGAFAAMFASVAEVVMIGEGSDAVDEREAGTEEHFDQAALARVVGHIGETLIVFARLFAQKHGRFVVWDAHAFE